MRAGKGSIIRQRYYRDASTFFACVGGGIGLTAAAYAFQHGESWLSSITDGSGAPVSGDNPLLPLVASWVIAAVVALLGALLLGFSRRGGALTCLLAAALGFVGAVRFGGPVVIRYASYGDLSNLVLRPVHHWPVLIWSLAALPLAASSVVAVREHWAARSHGS
jgi:hypothetical protein